MRSYRNKRSGNSKVKKILIRILFVIVAAVVIAFGAILLGNHLLNKVAQLDKQDNNVPVETVETQIEPIEGLVITSTNAPSVFAATIDVREYETEEDMIARITELSAHYDTLIIKLYAEDDSLIYRSPAVCKALGIPTESDAPTLKKVISAVAAASVRNMRLCALIPSSADSSASASASVIDGILISELATYGFDEVMIRCKSLTYTEFTYSSAVHLSNYLTDCANNANSSCLVGVTLPAEFYLDASYVKNVQTIGSAVSFLGIDFSLDGMTASAEIFTSVSHDITSLLGSFQTYNMRYIINSTDKTAMAAEYTACVQNGLENICIMSSVLPEELSYDQSATLDPEETIETKPAEIEAPEENPYASTAEDYPESQKPAETQANENTPTPEETDKPWY